LVADERPESQSMEHNVQPSASFLTSLQQLSYALLRRACMRATRKVATGGLKPFAEDPWCSRLLTSVLGLPAFTTSWLPKSRLSQAAIAVHVARDLRFKAMRPRERSPLLTRHALKLTIASGITACSSASCMQRIRNMDKYVRGHV
jgi:hypothetical protein